MAGPYDIPNPDIPPQAGGWGDVGAALGSSTAGIGAGITGALGFRRAENYLSDIKEDLLDSMSDKNKAALAASPVDRTFWQMPFRSIGMQALTAAPYLAAAPLIPEGVIPGAIAAAGYGALSVAEQHSEGRAAVFNTPDEELRRSSKLYNDLRTSGLDEGAAKEEAIRQSRSFGDDAINFLINAGTAGSLFHARMRGSPFLPRVGAGALEVGATQAAASGASEYTRQSAEQRIGLRPFPDWSEVGRAGATGALQGALLGVVGGALNRARRPATGRDTGRPTTGIDPALERALHEGREPPLTPGSTTAGVIPGVERDPYADFIAASDIGAEIPLAGENGIAARQAAGYASLHPTPTVPGYEPPFRERFRTAGTDEASVPPPVLPTSPVDVDPMGFRARFMAPETEGLLRPPTPTLQRTTDRSVFIPRTRRGRLLPDEAEITGPFARPGPQPPVIDTTGRLLPPPSRLANPVIDTGRQIPRGPSFAGEVGSGTIPIGPGPGQTIRGKADREAAAARREGKAGQFVDTMGRIHDVHPDGTTTRHGENQPQSAVTVYITPRAAEGWRDFFGTRPQGLHLEIEGGRIVARTVEHDGVVEHHPNFDANYVTEPRQGLVPFEMFGETPHGYSSGRVGQPIKRVARRAVVERLRRAYEARARREASEGPTVGPSLPPEAEERVQGLVSGRLGYSGREPVMRETAHFDERSRPPGRVFRQPPAPFLAERPRHQAARRGSLRRLPDRRSPTEPIAGAMRQPLPEQIETARREGRVEQRLPVIVPSRGSGREIAEQESRKTAAREEAARERAKVPITRAERIAALRHQIRELSKHGPIKMRAGLKKARQELARLLSTAPVGERPPVGERLAPDEKPSLYTHFRLYRESEGERTPHAAPGAEPRELAGLTRDELLRRLGAVDREGKPTKEAQALIRAEIVDILRRRLGSPEGERMRSLRARLAEHQRQRRAEGKPSLPAVPERRERPVRVTGEELREVMAEERTLMGEEGAHVHNLTLQPGGPETRFYARQDLRRSSAPFRQRVEYLRERAKAAEERGNMEAKRRYERLADKTEALARRIEAGTPRTTTAVDTGQRTPEGGRIFKQLRSYEEITSEAKEEAKAADKETRRARSEEARAERTRTIDRIARDIIGRGRGAKEAAISRGWNIVNKLWNDALGARTQEALSTRSKVKLTRSQEEANATIVKAQAEIEASARRVLERAKDQLRARGLPLSVLDQKRQRATRADMMAAAQRGELPTTRATRAAFGHLLGIKRLVTALDEIKADEARGRMAPPDVAQRSRSGQKRFKQSLTTEQRRDAAFAKYIQGMEQLQEEVHNAAVARGEARRAERERRTGEAETKAETMATREKAAVAAFETARKRSPDIGKGRFTSLSAAAEAVGRHYQDLARHAIDEAETPAERQRAIEEYKRWTERVNPGVGLPEALEQELSHLEAEGRPKTPAELREELAILERNQQVRLRQIRDLAETRAMAREQNVSVSVIRSQLADEYRNAAYDIARARERLAEAERAAAVPPGLTAPPAPAAPAALEARARSEAETATQLAAEKAAIDPFSTTTVHEDAAVHYAPTAQGHRYISVKDEVPFLRAQIQKLANAFDGPKAQAIGRLMTVMLNKVAGRIANTNILVLDEAQHAKLFPNTPYAPRFEYSAEGQLGAGRRGIIVVPHEIAVGPDGLQAVSHEMVHAATQHALLDPANERQRKWLEMMGKEAKKFLDSGTKEDPDAGVKAMKEHGFTPLEDLQVDKWDDPAEFLASAMSVGSGAVQRFLMSMPAPRNAAIASRYGIGRRTSMWDALVARVANVFDLDRKELNMLDAVLRINDDLVSYEPPLTTERTADLMKAMRAGTSERVNLAVPAAVRDRIDDTRSLLPHLPGSAASWLNKHALKVMTAQGLGVMSRSHYAAADEGGQTHLDRAAADLGRMHNDQRELIDRIVEPVRRAGAALEQRYLGGGKWHDYQQLAQAETQWQVFSHLPADAQPHYARDPNAWQNWQARDRHATLQRQWNALPKELRDFHLGIVRPFLEKLHDDAARLLVANNLDILLPSVPAAAKEALARKIVNGTVRKADLEAHGDAYENLKALAENPVLKKLAVYSPLYREGDHIVAGTYRIDTPAGATRLADNRFQFPSMAAARRWAAPLPYKLLRVAKVAGSDAVNVTVQNKHVEFFESAVRARQRHAELGNATKGVDADGRRMTPLPLDLMPVREKAWEPQEVNRFLLHDEWDAALKRLHNSPGYAEKDPQAQAFLERMFMEQSLRALGPTRIQANRLPRAYVEGASPEMVQNLGRYGLTYSGYLSRLRYMPRVDAAMKAAKEELASMANGKPEHYEAARQLYNELHQRLYDQRTPAKEGLLYNFGSRLLQLTHMQKLASPAYHTINASDPWMVTLPDLAGEHGYAAAAKALNDAYADIGGRWGTVGQGIKDTIAAANRDFKRFDYMAAYLDRIRDPGKRAVLQEMISRGLVSADAGMELQRALKPSQWALGRGIDRVDKVTRQLGTAIEAMNRTVTALASYRLARGKGMSEARAKQYAIDKVYSTQGEYGAWNAPPIFNKPGWRHAFQFRKYGQRMYQMMAMQLRQARENGWFKTAEGRESLKALAYVLSQHVLVAGMRGLPLEPIKAALLIAGLAGATDVTYTDVERKWRELMVDLLGPDLGQIVHTGAPRWLGLDLQRMGLDNLMLPMQDPQSYKSQDLLIYAAQALFGASGSVASNYPEGIRLLAKGDFWGAAPYLVPVKLAGDFAIAMNRLDSITTPGGKLKMAPYSDHEALIRILGFTPGREAELNDMRGFVQHERAARTSDRRQLIADWLKAKTPEERQDVWEDIQDSNSRLPPIAQLTVRQLESIERRRQQELATGHDFYGIAVGPKDEDLVRSARKYYGIGASP